MELKDGFYWIKFRAQKEEGWTVGRRMSGKHPWEIIASDEWADDEDLIVGPYLGEGPSDES